MRRGDETERNNHSKIRFQFSVILEYRAWLNHRGEQKCETYGSAGTFGTAAFCPDVPSLENAQSLTPLKHLHGSNAGKEKPESNQMLSGNFC